MKKTLIIIIVALLFLTVGAVALIISKTESGSPVQTEVTIHSPASGFGITAYTKNNPCLPFDLNAYITENEAYFFLPADVDMSALTYSITDETGKEILSLCADFTDGKKYGIDFSDKKLALGAMQTDLPSVCISIDPGYASFEELINDKYKKTYAYGDMAIYVPEKYASEFFCSDSYISREDDPDSPGTVRLSAHGHSSWMYLEKKSFNIKLEDGDSLLGMSSDKKWVLNSNHFDRSLIRNTIVYSIARRLNFAYTANDRAVELYVDGNYQGSYVLSEKVEVDSDRLDITDLEEATEDINDSITPTRATVKELTGGLTIKFWDDYDSPEDITGGYLLEVDIASRAKQATSWVKTSHDRYFVIKSPEYASYDEVMYIADLVQGFEDAIYTTNGYNYEGKHFTEYADLETLAARYVLDEICRNPDSGESSTFFYKDSDKIDGTLYSGPVWDYDLAFANYMKFTDAEGFEAQTRFYYPQLFKHKVFTDEVARQYEIISKMYREAVDSDIGEYADFLSLSAKMNFTRWDVMNTDIRVSPKQSAPSIEGSVEYVRDWLEKRLDWLDENLYEVYK